MIDLARRTPRRLLALAALTLALVVGAFASGLATHALAEDYVDGERLLPGVTIAGVAVGGMSVEEASDAVAADVERRLDQDLRITDGERTWPVTPRELGASVDVESAVAEAAEASASRAGRGSRPRGGAASSSRSTLTPR